MKAVEGSRRIQRFPVNGSKAKALERDVTEMDPALRLMLQEKERAVMTLEETVEEKERAVRTLQETVEVVRRVLQEEEIRGELWSERSTPPDELSPLSAPSVSRPPRGLHGPQRGPPAPPQPPHGEGVALWWSSTSWRGLGLPRDPLCSSAPTLALRTRSTLAHSEQDFHFPKHVICDRAPQCFYIPPLPLNVHGASGGYWLRRWTGNRRVSGSSPDR
ncbi:uncharacterized protein LOC115560158 isoform X2 [Gadus morhua]|uniref:uncharacterized protein LOC115560158 isoform X2 n=1 Tax=Gadus morhua TaxID=8049 RepID=UPI0011B6EA8C|nr:uncharacterized protein LOC115560158 isoform X2 [Gadus morhua]